MQADTYLVNVDGVVVRDGRYLLIERAADEANAGGALAFPGGTVEQPPGSENPIETTVRRELNEEVGIEVGDVAYVTSRTFETDDGSQCINIVTMCEHVRGEPFPRAPDEVAAVHWLTADEIRARDPPAFFQRYVDRVEAYRHVD